MFLVKSIFIIIYVIVSISGNRQMEYKFQLI